MRRCEVFTVVAVIGLSGVVLPAALRGQDQRAGRALCANHLRQLGLAAIQYADDRRFFPHLGPMGEVGPGYDSSSSTRIVRSLAYFGYHDSPEGFVCPDTSDRAHAVSAAAKADMHRWFWGGEDAKADPARSPLQDGALDPALPDTGELSYGWTRRGMNLNTRATSLLAADRALRNHEGAGRQVLQADGACSWTVKDDAAEALLVSVDRATGGGALAVQAAGERDPVGSAGGLPHGR